MASACTRLEQAATKPPVSIQGGFAGEGAGGEGSFAGEGGESNGGSPPSLGGAPATIELGVWPSFAAEPDTDPDALAVLSAVSALSAGSAVLPLVERWDALSGATGSPRAVAWANLDAQALPYRDAGRKVALCIAVLDRSLDARPFAGELDTPAARSALERTIDEAFAHFSTELTQLCLGYELDRFVAEIRPAERAQLLAFLEHAVKYATEHSQRSPTTTIGVAVTLEAIATGMPSGIDDFTQLGSAVIAVYDPLTASSELKAPESVASDLEAALARIEETRPAGDVVRPFSLFEAGYPSAQALGSSERAQKLFFQALLDTLDASRGQVVSASLFGLGDRAAEQCDTEAPAFGGVLGSAQASRSLARCSSGLWAEADQPKLAWSVVLAALSKYR